MRPIAATSHGCCQSEDFKKQRAKGTVAVYKSLANEAVSFEISKSILYSDRTTATARCRGMAAGYTDNPTYLLDGAL